MQSTIAHVLLGAVATVLIAITTWLIVVYSGAYNVSATDAHADVIRWSFNTAMRHSVAGRSGEIALPDQFTEAEFTEGAGHYAESCVHCHGAPGVEPADWAKGMRPEPPELAEAAKNWSAEEIHWIVEHGIKMTGMPAFGQHHDEQELLAITAFVTELPGLTSEGYADATSRAGHQGHGAEGEPPAAPDPKSETNPMSTE